MKFVFLIAVLLAYFAVDFLVAYVIHKYVDEGLAESAVCNILLWPAVTCFVLIAYAIDYLDKTSVKTSR